MDLGKLQKGVESRGIAHLIGKLDVENVILPLLGIEIDNWNGPWANSSCPDIYGLHSDGDSSPSFGVNTETLSYQCFVCGGGSLDSLVADMLEISPEDAVLWLEDQSADVLGKDEKYVNRVAQVLANVEQRLLSGAKKEEIMPEYPPDLLFQYDEIHPYVFERGISPEVAEEMQIGFTREHMGIVIPHFFQDKLVGIQYRHLAMNDGVFLCPDPYCNPPHKKKVPKYRNTRGFPRLNTVYNIDNASEYTNVIVVESPFTVLYLMSHGFRNVVATFGAHFTSEQATCLLGFEKVFLWADNDLAGKGWFERVDRKGKKHASPGLILLEKSVRSYVVPVVSGAKADPADLAPTRILDCLARAYSTRLIPVKGVEVYDQVQQV